MTYEIGDVILEYGVRFEVQMWSITDILRKVTLSSDYDGGWNNIEFDGSPSHWAFMIASKAGDYHTPVLAQKILDEGFTEPICIWQDSRGAYGIGNGHHRLVCAIMLGLDEIPVLFSGTEENYPDASEGEELSEYDSESADMLYYAYSKIYKTLLRQEQDAACEEESMRKKVKVWR